MTPERRVALLQRIVAVLLFVGIAIAAWNYQRPAKASPEEVARDAEKKGKPGMGPMKSGDEKAGNPIGTNHIRTPKDPSSSQVKSILKNVVGPDGGVAIIHCHLPGDPASEQLADTFNLIQKKYGKLVAVTRVGFPAQPTDWQAQGIKLPYVMMIVGKESVFQFQGLWSYSQVEKKVEEIIFGLRRVGKDWRPVVPGMSPKSR